MGNNSKVKKNSLNRSKRKIIPMCYQKLNLSRSNTSLSHLISLGVYKRRINDLVKNNRLLAVALQESRLENSYQSNLLKEFARCSNQMKIFKFKVNEMVKTTITKLVSDVNEIVKSLDDDWSVDGYNFLQNKGPHDRIRIKGPTVECVEEEGSALISEGEECETVPNEIRSEETRDERDVHEMEPTSSKSQANSADIPDMPPILYIDDSEDQSSKKKSSRKSKSRSSSRKRIANNQLSLTPELDIDLDFMIERQSSSRRQTQVFTPVRSMGRSRKASSVGPTFIEHETPKNSLIRRESMPQRKLSPVLIICDQNSENVDKLEVMNVNTKTRGSKNNNISDLQLSSVNTDDNSVNINNSSHNVLMVYPEKNTVSNVANNDCFLANQTILMTEDMELTDVVRPIAEMDIGSNPADIPKAPLNSFHNVADKAEKLNLEPENKFNDSKFLAYTEDTEVIQLDECLNIVEKENGDSISNVMSPCKINEPSKDALPVDKSPSESPFQRRSSRRRKNLISLEFSSTDSENDFTPVSSCKKRRIQRDTVIYKPQKISSGVLPPSENAKKSPLVSKEVHKVFSSALSVYDLDVSNSKKPVKKYRPRNKTKSSLTKEIAKPLSQKCSITKLKGAECKFSKNENFSINNKENQQSEINKEQEPIKKGFQNNAAKQNPCIFTSDLNDIAAEENPESEIRKQQEANPKFLQNNAANEIPSIFTFGLNKIVAEDEKSIGTSRDELSSPKVADSKEISFKSPGARRVSFASTDVVCNFTRMSIPKAIEQNKRVHRISKSNFNTFDFNFREPKMNETKQCSSDINPLPQFETDNTNLMEKSHNYVTGSNHEGLESELHKEAKTVPGKSTQLALARAFITTDSFKLGKSSDVVKVSLPNKASVISTTSTDENVNSILHTEVAMHHKDPKHIVPLKTVESFGSKSQKLPKISNKKLEKCVLVKTNDHKVLKSLEKYELNQQEVFSHNPNHISEKPNSELIKKNLNSRKSIPAHIEDNMIKDADSKTSPKRLPVLKKAQKQSSATSNENSDLKSVKKTLNSPKNVQSCGGSNMVESKENTKFIMEIQAPSSHNVLKEIDSGSLKERSDVQPHILDSITGDLNLKSLKETEKKEETHNSSSKVEVASGPPKKNKQSRKKALQPISGKIHEDISTLSKCSNPSSQSKNNNPNEVVAQDDFKEDMLNNHHVLDRAQADPCVKTKKSQHKSLPSTDNFKNKAPEEDKVIEDHAQAVSKRAILSLESCHPSHKKSSNLRLSVESSPVLKDVMNLEENLNKRESTRRAKTLVSYKEPKLNKKMRRE